MSNEPRGRKAFQAARKLLREKGYYIVLFLCVAAVGISGYVFIRTAISAHRDGADSALSLPDTLPTQDVTLDVPLTATDPEEKPAAGTDAQTPSDAAVTTMTDEEVGQIAAQTVIRPVSGQTARAYSMDALIYSQTMADWRVHNGIDIETQAGAQVLAAMAGTVTAVYEDEFYGTTVEITHEGGYRTVYANLTPTALVSAGQSVSAGTVLGAVGESALAECADGPHLHFSVLLGTDYVDPETFLP